MGEPKSILLIEDNQHEQFFFIQALIEIGTATLFHVANNGREALDKLTSSHSLPDLVVTDIHMPVMDGIQYLTQAMNIPVIKDIPVVVLSNDTSQIESVSQLGARAFIEKPVDFISLKRLIIYILEMGFMNAETAADCIAFQFIRSNYNIGTNL